MEETLVKIYRDDEEGSIGYHTKMKNRDIPSVIVQLEIIKKDLLKDYEEDSEEN